MKAIIVEGSERGKRREAYNVEKRSERGKRFSSTSLLSHLVTISRRLILLL